MPGAIDGATDGAIDGILGARILIVDDQESNLRLLEYTLRRAGHLAVSSTSDPVAACALHRLNRYHLILLDLQMPRMNGFEVMAELARIEGSRVAVLVLSADPAQMVRALEAGASGFLSKPFVLGEVVKQVHGMLEKVLARRRDPAQENKTVFAN
jgi:DNA-binding response OmpR family regulator